jgi:hypothetical protein
MRYFLALGREAGVLNDNKQKSSSGAQTADKAPVLNSSKILFNDS